MVSLSGRQIKSVRTVPARTVPARTVLAQTVAARTVPLKAAELIIIYTSWQAFEEEVEKNNQAPGLRDVKFMSVFDMS
jgi:hypothetical protein